MKFTLGLFLTLLGLPGIRGVAADDIIGYADKPCRARAWVRAPDLGPGKLVRGDVKVKFFGMCQDVLSYTLKLRFAERSWVKTRRQGVQLPDRPTVDCSIIVLPENGTVNGLPKNRSIFEPNIWRNPFLKDKLDWDRYEEAVKDPSLWLVREEERIGFEASYNLCDGKCITHGVVVNPFAILVPSTIYPPAFDSSSRLVISYILDAAGSEHIYEYVVDVAFSNGTVLEVPAGYTAFDSSTKRTTPFELETVNVTVPLPLHRKDMNSSEAVDREDVDNFILEVTFPHGRHFERGSVNNITIVSHQVGPRIERPGRIGWIGLQGAQKLHWAASMAADNKTAEELLTRDVGRHLESPRWFDPENNNDDLTRPRFPQDWAQAGQNGKMFSTSPITVQFRVSEDCYPQFDMQYETIGVELKILIEMQNIPSSNKDIEENDWVPVMRQSNVQQATLMLQARIPIFIHSRQDDQTEMTETIHYLSPNARAPVFVDPGTVQNLLQKSTDERDILSPKAQPKFITHEGSDVVKERYFARSMRGKQLSRKYYVGETWLREVVLPSAQNAAEKLDGGLRIQP